MKPFGAQHAVHLALCGATYLHFLTVVDTYMQVDLPQIDHGWHSEEKQHARKKINS